MNELIKKLNINEKYTKPLKKSKSFTKVRDNVPHIANYNFMADLLFLPTTKDGYKYLLVVVDIGTNAVDFEPLKVKQPKDILKAMKDIFDRDYLDKPYASIATDSGTEFKGVFHKYLFDENILHKIGEPGRHKQMANVENMNRTLGRLLNGYMNSKEEETSKNYNEWTDVLDTIREDLNEIRKLPVGDPYTDEYDFVKLNIVPRYKVGDLVYRKTEHPLNALRQKQPTANFRMGDYRFELLPRRIAQVLRYPGKVPVRYILDDLPNVSYSANELRPAKEKEAHYDMKKILDKKKMNGRIHYLIWWKGFPKNQSTWQPRTELIKDIPDELKAYDAANK